MIYGLLVLIFIQQASLIVCQVIPHVPCPEIFQYIYDGRKWTAQITVPTPDVNKVVLTVNFTVPETHLKDNGKLNLNNKDNAIKDIENHRPFKYTLTFPKTKNIPQITGITYNGNVICIGPKLGPPNTSFWLAHTLNWYSSAIILPQKPDITTQQPTYKPQTQWPQQPQITNSIIPETSPKPPNINKNKYKNDLNCGMIREKRDANDPDVIPFIYNGVVIPRNNHPWLAAMYHTETGPITFFCGGNLISNKHVLTAAHCTINKKKIEVKIGAHNAQEIFDLGSIIRYAVKITNHEDYTQGSAHADISIIHLSETVDFTATVKPICLWNIGDNINSIIGRQGTIMGWGLTEVGVISSIPLQTDVTIASQRQCQSVDILKNSISDMTFCAGTKGAGPCLGDSGGGLLLKNQGRWYLRGIISLSIANRRSQVCDVNTYAVYVDTAKYMDWIVDKMK